jgi:hypothetical protein
MRDEVWGPGLSALRDQCRFEELLGSVVQEIGHALLHDIFPGCRLFRIDSELRGGGVERLATQRFFVLRPGDATAYQLLHHGQMVALARAEEIHFSARETVAAFASLALGFEGEPSVEPMDSAWLVAGRRPGEPRGEQLILALDAGAQLQVVVRVQAADPAPRAHSQDS